MFLELILSLSTMIIFIVFALKPTILTIVSLYKEINQKRSTLSSLNQKITDLQTAANVYDQSQDFIPNVNAAVFGNPEPDTVSKQLLGLASKNGANLLGISIGQTIILGKSTTVRGTSDVKPLPENAQSMPVSISIRGNYSSLLGFIKDIENLRIPIKVDTLSIGSSQTQEGNVIVGVITARVPYLGEQ